MPTETATLLETALAYAARGWPVFPCHTPSGTGCSCRKPHCDDIGKHPRVSGGFKAATTDAQQLEAWWRKWPHANIGLRTGAELGIILDIDPAHGGNESLAQLEARHSPLPRTLEVVTGSDGGHRYFAHPGEVIRNSAGRLGLGLDIRGDGGYIIAPPSLHASGKRYAWKAGHELDDTPLAPLPSWLLRLLTTTKTRQRTHTAHDDGEQPIREGARNDALFRFGCTLRRQECSAAIILAALQAMNAERCVPPLSDDEVEQIAASASHYQPGDARADARHRQNGHAPPRELRLKDTTGDATKRMPFLWWPYIPRVGLTFIDGDPGIGKTMLVLTLAAITSRGWPFPDQAGKVILPGGTPAMTLYFSNENLLEYTIKPRLAAAEADRTLIKHVQGVEFANGTRGAFTLAEEYVPLLEARLEEFRPALVIFDPIQSYLGALDLHRANETRPVLDRLSELSERFECAIVGLRHPTKASGDAGRLLYRGLGSVDLTGAARSVLYCERHPVHPDTQVLLVHAKSNRETGCTQIFSTEDGNFAWQGVTRITASTFERATGPAPRALMAAAFWLETVVTDVPMPLTDLEELADGEGIGAKLLR